MTEPKKVLQMNFVTKDGGSFRISVGNTLDELTPGEINAAMDIIVGANVFITKTGEIIGKSKARYVTQEIEDVEIQS